MNPLANSAGDRARNQTKGSLAADVLIVAFL